MQTFITQQLAASLARVSEREVRKRLRSGEYHGQLAKSGSGRGGQVERVALDSLPGPAQLEYWKKVNSSESIVHSLEPGASDSRLSTINCQLPLPYEDGEAFRDLPTDLRGYVEKWFQVLAPTDVLHWNGLWKSRYFNRVFCVAAPDGGLPREFKITTKTALMEYLAASHQIPVRTLYTRRQELRAFFSYLESCRQRGAAPDAATMAAFFPARAKDVRPGPGGQRPPLQHRADRGVSKTITAEVQQWLLAQMSRGSRPGQDGWRGTIVDAVRVLEDMRQYLETIQHPDAANFKVPSVSAVRRWLRAQPLGAKGPPASDPALVWSRQGSKRFHELVVPSTPRAYDMFVHDWWESDHHKGDLWVFLDSDPRIVFRPWSTWWYDVRSRWPVSFVLSIVPSSVTIMRAWKEALLRHLIAPRHTTCDNGKDYLAHVLEGVSHAAVSVPPRSNDRLDAAQLGLIKRFGTEPHHTLPSSTNQRTGEKQCHAQSKIIERFFQNLLPFDRAQRGACGENPEGKPDKCDAEKLLHREAIEKWDGASPFVSPLMPLSQYGTLLSAHLLTEYGARVHRGEGMSCTPLEAFARYRPERFGIERNTLTPEQIGALMLTAPRPATVRNMEITVTLSGRTEHYRHADFQWLTGEQVQVEVDPSDPEEVWVSYNGRFVGRAERVGKAAYGNAPQGLIAAEQKLKHYLLRSTKERVKLLSAATFLPSQEQLAAMRVAVADASHSREGGNPGIPHAESLERGTKTLKAEAAAAVREARPGPPIDAAQFVAGQPEAESPAPSLYELNDCTVETE
jgi:hypothetical protein